MATIAFIGLGLMGGPMSAQLVRAGHTVLGYDSSEASRRAAVTNGVLTAQSSRAAAAQSDALITMLPAGKDVRSVLLDDDRLLHHVRAGTVVIDSSSIDIETTREIHAESQALGIHFVDAPVSGGVGGAIAGTLTFMVGGTAESVRLASPILAAMGRKIAHAGGAAAGQATKMCNNLLFGSTLVAVSEAFLLAQRLGLDPKTFFETVSSSSGDCWALHNFCPVPGVVAGSAADNGYAAKFSARLMSKDLHLALDAARGAGQPLPVGTRASALYDALVASDPGLDASAIIRQVDVEVVAK